MHKNIIKDIGINLICFIISGFAGMFIAIQYGLRVWIPDRTAQLSPGCGVFFGTLAFIALAVLFFGIIGCILGGAVGILVYQLICIATRRIAKKKK